MFKKQQKIDNRLIIFRNLVNIKYNFDSYCFMLRNFKKFVVKMVKKIISIFYHIIIDIYMFYFNQYIKYMLYKEYFKL